MEDGRRLKSIVGNGHNISYKYNDVGIRTEKTVDGATTKYYLSGDKVILEDNGTDKIYFTYDSNDSLVSMNLNNIEYYYIRNAQGDIIGLFDSSGIQVVRYYYDNDTMFINVVRVFLNVLAIIMNLMGIFYIKNKRNPKDRKIIIVICMIVITIIALSAIVFLPPKGM